MDKKLYNVAILIYDGVYLLDFTGPLEIFTDTYSKDGQKLFNTYTVSPDSISIKAHCKLEVISDYNIVNMPQPDIFVVPGGNLSLINENMKLKSWFLKTAENSDIILSVCTGAFILSDAGMLDGLEVTTWYGAVNKLQQLTHKARVVSNKRVTDNGKVITTAGVSAGIDGALHVVERLFGSEIAKATAKYIEYDWRGK